MAVVGPVVGATARERGAPPPLGVTAATALVLVTGHPAVGKTRLAEGLSRELQLPLFRKDAVKERLFDVIGWGDRARSRVLSRAATAILYDQLEAVLLWGSAIAESNFDARRAGPPLRAVLERTGAGAVQVVVTAPPEIVLGRFRRRAAARERHPGHLDHLLVAELEPVLTRPYIAPDLPGPRLTVDATDLEAVDPASVALEVRAAVAGLPFG